MAPLAAPRLMIVAAAACLALLAAQLWLIGRVELTFDEAYYTLWSRSLAWGYLDHPPAHRRLDSRLDGFCSVPRNSAYAR